MLTLATVMPAASLGHEAHFGSNRQHICDTTVDSQCKADDATHRVYRSGLESDQQSAIAWAITNVYTFAATDVTMLTVSAFDSLTDVGVTDGTYGSTGDWAWTACADDATYGAVVANDSGRADAFDDAEDVYLRALDGMAFEDILAAVRRAAAS